MNLIIRSVLFQFLLAGLAGGLYAQTLSDLGPTAPTPGPNDIYQFSTQGNQTAPDNLNYYTDNQTGHGTGEPGQTFTTGTNAAGYMLTSVAVRTGGLGSSTYNGISTLQPYYLHIYSISGSVATLLLTYTSGNITFNDGDWLKWTGLSVPLSANATYAYSFGKASSTTGWEPMAVATSALSGGEIALIPTTGGSITTGSSHTFDAVFDLGLVLATTPSVSPVTLSPAANVRAGIQMAFTASVAGAPPIYYQWRFNSGSGFVNLSGANTNTLSFVAAVTNTGSYQLVLTNSYGAVTSAPVALVVAPAFTNIPASMPWPMPTYGMNVGNELELNWGPPNAALFYSAAFAGFNAVRIPCAWDMSGATTNVSGGVTNYVIAPSYMAQVKQTVDAAIATGMYVMINDHWDDGWLEQNIGTTVDPVINAKVKAYWTQIATTFAGYDNHLLFAAANEPNVNNTAEEVTLMYYYQTFVNAVRSVGGNNTNRWLVIQSIADPTWMNALPTDTVSNRIMVEYHNYTPSLFTIIHTDQSWGNAIYFWGPAYHYSGDPTRNATWGEEYAQDSFYQQLADLYVSKGIPVMIGEFQAAPASLTNATEATWNRDSTLYWNKYVAESARGHGLSPFYWSTGGSPFDYTTGAINDSQVVAALTGGAVPPPPNGAPYAASGLTATGGVGQVTLSWAAGSGATSYNLYRSTASGLENSNAAPVITGITGTSYTNTGLNSGITYYYQVVATNSSGASGFSAEACATTSGSADTAQFNFETGTQGWYGGGGIISGVAASTAQHFAGNQSLAVNFTGAASGSSSASVNSVAVVPGSTITFNVWIPSGSQVTTLQPYLQDNTWAWTSGWYPSLTANAWNTITLTVPTNAVSPLQKLGIVFITSAGWTGTCYIDSVSLATTSPDFNLSANPTSLTVNGGTNGTSTVTVTALYGLNACYTLSASNLPSGVFASFTNNPSTGGASLLTLTASNNVISGTTNVTVIATAGLISHTTTIALTLNSIIPPNTPPTLAPIANQTVNVGQTVAFTASATDTDLPPQTLTFALLAGATNATLNSSSGSFSFRPLVTQANSTNNFTLQVSDNGTPSMSATQSFSVVVNPLSAPSVSNVSAAGGQFGFAVSGQSGPDYAVETSTNLTQWNTVFVTNSPALPFVWTDTNSAEPQRFYRVKLGPPLP
ncbi:MAG TPA: cellulase family glycosylhydrolase [Candidatus Limnocylindrales bacterium]|nr:cellulase family glycosylhydrolase [Candidatus Limnocylindrales bacterium]